MFETRLAEVASPSFARHETFPPRFGWLRKAFVALWGNSEAFLEKDATVTLGVGKNMVNAIRYWSGAFKLAVEHPRGGKSRAYTASPTWKACWLLHEEGADPYLEDPGSLWLLHWWLLTPEPFIPCSAPTWWAAFNTYPSVRFSEAELADVVARHARLAGWSPPAPASINKDVDCLTKMYAPRKAPTGSPGSFEDLLDCPFRELGLLEAVPGRVRSWRFSSTARATLPARVAAYACLDYASRHTDTAGSVALARLTNEPGGPGRAFQIREPELASALEEASAQQDQVSISEALGQRSLVFDGDPKELAWDLLDSHYDHARRRVPTEDEWLTQRPELAAELARRQRQNTAFELTRETT